MPSQNALAHFIKYSESLIESCRKNPKVIGLVLVGSTAETDRFQGRRNREGGLKLPILKEVQTIK